MFQRWLFYLSAGFSSSELLESLSDELVVATWLFVALPSVNKKSAIVMQVYLNVPVLNDNINTKQNSQFFLLKFGLWILPWNLRLIETEQDNFNLVIQATRCKTRISYSGTLSHSCGAVQCVDCQNIMHDSDFRRPYKSL